MALADESYVADNARLPTLRPNILARHVQGICNNTMVTVSLTYFNMMRIASQIRKITKYCKQFDFKIYKYVQSLDRECKHKSKGE